MSTSRRNQDYRRIRDAQVAEVRRGSSESVEPMGYSPGGAARSRPIPGDEKFPFFKDVPDVEGPYRLGAITEIDDGVVNPIPQVAVAADLSILETIDVRGIRLLTCFFEYFPDDGQLIIVPDGMTYEPEDLDASAGQEQWFPIGVVDPVLTVVGPLLTGGGFRYVYSTELRINGAGLDFSTPIRLTAVFDVAPYREMRLRVGDTGAAAGLNILYSLER